MDGLLFGKEKAGKKRRHHPKNVMGARKGLCYLCGKYGPTEEHHIFGGPNRRLSEEYGLKVDLCLECHQTGPKAVHRDKETMQMLHELGQQAFENTIGSRDGFVKVFGKNYIEGDEYEQSGEDTQEGQTADVPEV